MQHVGVEVLELCNVTRFDFWLLPVFVWLLLFVSVVFCLFSHTSWSFSPFADIAYVNEWLDNTATYHHTKMANQGRDVDNRTGRFRASGHLLNDVCRQQCCCAPSSLNYCSVFRTLEWVYRCTVSGLMPLHTAAPCLLQQSLSGVHFVGENKRLSKCIEILDFHFPAFFPQMTSTVPNSLFST